MPDERAAEAPALNPALSRQHLLVLLPFVGLFFVWRARSRATAEADRAELTAAIRCQVGGTVVWLVHLVLQAAILGVWWLVTVTPSGESLLEVSKAVVLAGTGLNVLMLLIEWGVLVVAAFGASRGRPYPLSRGERRRAAAQGRAEHRKWKPLHLAAGEPQGRVPTCAPEGAGSRTDPDNDD